MTQLIADFIDATPFMFNALVLFAVLICLPLAFFRRTRHFSGSALIAVGSLTAVLTWISLFVSTWGGGGLAFAIVMVLSGVGIFLTGVYYAITLEGLNGIIGTCIMISIPIICVIAGQFLNAKSSVSSNDLKSGIT